MAGNEFGTSIAEVGDCGRPVGAAADVGQEAGQRPPQRDKAGGISGVQSCVGDFPRGSRIPGTAQRGSQHDITLDAVTAQCGLGGLSQLDPAFGMGGRDLPLTAGHRQFRGHPGQPDRESRRRGPPTAGEFHGASEQDRGGSQPADSQSVGGESGQRVDTGFRIAFGTGQGRTVQVVGTLMPAQLTQELGSRAVRQRHKSGAGAAADQLRQVGVGAGVAALSTGRHRPQPEFVGIARRRQWPPAGIVAERGCRKGKMHRLPTLSIAVKSLCAARYGHVNGS